MGCASFKTRTKLERPYNCFEKFFKTFKFAQTNPCGLCLCSEEKARNILEKKKHEHKLKKSTSSAQS
jgi:hypothetical protein